MCRLSDFQELNTDLKNYWLLMERMANEENESPVPNATKEYANIALTFMLKHAKKEVWIYDQDLSGDILTAIRPFRAAIESFLDRIDTDIHFFIQDDKSIHKEWDAIMSKYPNKIHVETAQPDMIEILNTLKVTSFTVTDDNALRLEFTADISKEEMAFVSFNSPKSVESLIKLCKTYTTLVYA